MASEAEILRQEFSRFSTDMLHGLFPGIDLVQLDSGPLRGWITSATVGPYRINAGSFDRVLLYEGRYNPEMVHVGFIYSRKHRAASQAHVYDSGVLSLDCGTSYMHEVFPANMIWVNIFAPEALMMKGIPYSKERLHDNPHLLLEGSRDGLMPLIELVDGIMLKPTGKPPKSTPRLATRLGSILQALLSSRFTEDAYEQPFVAGDLFRMSLLSRLEKLSLSNGNMPLSLAEICTAARMKPRTIQKYFHDLYGMGPTEYFRIRRFNGARTELMTGTIMVSDAATRWGFIHFGRFAGTYKTLFNESPRNTTKQGRGSPQDLHREWQPPE